MRRHASPLISIPAIMAATWLAGACAGAGGPVTRPSPPGSEDPVGTAPELAEACDHTKVRWTIGERASPELLEKAQQAAGARTARFLRPGQMITMEYVASRLNLELDEQGNVQRVRCG
jgi:hypothetical protein